MKAQTNRVAAIVESAVRAATMTAGAMESGAAAGAAAQPTGESIQDGDGRLYMMCGVSVCGGPDVAG